MPQQSPVAAGPCCSCRSRSAFAGLDLTQRLSRVVGVVDAVNHERARVWTIGEPTVVEFSQKVSLLLGIQSGEGPAFCDAFLVVVPIADTLGPQCLPHIVGAAVLELPHMTHLMCEKALAQWERAGRNVDGI